ncbi:class I SAM-dependent methyltransferase [Achromobacter xylosoxidans]
MPLPTRATKRPKLRPPRHGLQDDRTRSVEPGDFRRLRRNALPFQRLAPNRARPPAGGSASVWIDSAPLAGARVLELACAAGGNLIPFAVAHPNAQVIGIDLSPEQVNAGREVVEKLGLRNLDLRALSITDIDDSLGKFDYIICHGVFSWVPPVVREAILRVCRDNLAPEGIAFISYNVYPGWKTSDILRDAMQLNSFSATTPAEKLKKAKEMLGLLQHGLSTNNLMREAISKAAHP